MKLLHATDLRNLPGIKRLGLLAGLAKGRRKAVWGVTPDYLEWALAHVLSKGKVKLKDIVVLSFTVPDAWVKRFRWSGLCYVERDVPAGRVKIHGRVSLTREKGRE